MSNERTSKPRRIPLDLSGLSGTPKLFLLNRSFPSDPAVASWLHVDETELRTIAKHWFLQMRRCGDDVREAMHDGCPVACVDVAPFAYVNVFTNHVNVGFFNGSSLDDPAHLLRGNGKSMRHVKLTLADSVDPKALSDLIAASYADIKSRVT